MSAENIIHDAVTAGLCIFLFLWPCDGDAAKIRNDDRSAGRKTSQRQRDKKTAPPITEKPASISPDQVLPTLISSARNAKDMSEENRAILAEALTVITKTPRGKWVLSNVSPKVRFAELPESVSANGVFGHGSLRLSINKRLFNAVSKAKTPTERQAALSELIRTMIHELTHAAQNNRSVCCRIHGLSTSDWTLMNKLRELHAIVEADTVKDQLLELSEFRALRGTRHSVILLRKMRINKVREGLSPEAAERAARTEFMKAFWRDVPSDPIRLGKDLIFLPRIEGWNRAYNRVVFEHVLTGRPAYYRDTGKPVDGELRRAASFMGVDISPSFFQKEKPFTFERGRFTTYLDGIKDQEMDYLTVGHMVKTYFDGRLNGAHLEVTHPKNGSFTDYWYGTKRPRAAYTIEDKNPVGVYREYDYSGQQIAEIPFSGGRANGTGWVIEGGERVECHFERGWRNLPGAPKDSKCRTSSFWRARYLEKQCSGEI